MDFFCASRSFKVFFKVLDAQAMYSLGLQAPWVDLAKGFFTAKVAQLLEENNGELAEKLVHLRFIYDIYIIYIYNIYNIYIYMCVYYIYICV